MPTLSENQSDVLETLAHLGRDGLPVSLRGADHQSARVLCRLGFAEYSGRSGSGRWHLYTITSAGKVQADV